MERVTVNHAKINGISNYTNYFPLFIMIFGFNKRYLEKNEYRFATENNNNIPQFGIVSSA